MRWKTNSKEAFHKASLNSLRLDSLILKAQGKSCRNATPEINCGNMTAAIRLANRLLRG